MTSEQDFETRFNIEYEARLRAELQLVEKCKELEALKATLAKLNNNADDSPPADSSPKPKATSITAEAPQESATTPEGLGEWRVLLAEDSVVNQRVVAHLLKKEGIEASLVADGKSAMDTALEAVTAGQPFDCILMDMEMPIMSGYQASRELRRRGYNGPIIALTAHSTRDDRKKCILNGCTDFTPKPIKKDVLFKLMAKHCRQRPTSVKG